MRPPLPTVCALLLLTAATPALAATCGDRPVRARGDSSRFEFLAKVAARGNWRAKVRAMPTLGAAYANWSKALAAEYSCSRQDARYVCVAIAQPCRP
jgi:hypothetical protein